MELPTPVLRLCHRLAAVFAGSEAADVPPVYHHRNSLGNFVFRAFGLSEHGDCSADPEPAPLIGIHIRPQEPLTVRAVRGLRYLPALSRRQLQIFLRLVDDVANLRIAREMNMTTHTVVTHTRRLYEKLDVHNRPELVAKLTAL